MSSKMKLSKRVTEELDFLSESLNLRRNIVCRMALGLSLNENEPPSTEFEDSLGQEFNKPTILGVDESLFNIMVSQHFSKKLPEEDVFSTYIRAEISRGIDMMFKHYKRVNSQVQFLEELVS